jgi:glycosyltransferase involved in cell wall biosynthesis
MLVGYSPSFHRAAFLAAWRGGYPLLFRGETNDQSRVRTTARDLVRRRLLRAFYARCEKLLFIGRRSHEHFTALGCPADRLVFSPYCVDTAPFQVDEAARTRLRREARREMGLEDAHGLLLFSGKLSTRKDPALLIQAVRELPVVTRAAVTVAFLGDGPMRAWLEEEAGKAPSIHARFLGFRNQTELSRVYHAADLLVLPSRERETWGLVVNEALHHGVPCVVSDAVGCAPDLIVPGRTGEIFERGSAASLARALERAGDLVGRADVRRSCRDQVAGYSVDRAAQGIAEAFDGTRH